MPADQRIGSQAPLWRTTSPGFVWRALVVVLVLFAGSITLTSFDDTGMVVAAWVFGILAGAMALGATVGFGVLRWLSAKTRRYATSQGLAFAVRDRRRTDSWRIAPDCDGALSRDVVTGTVAGRPFTSFLHQSYIGFRRNTAKATGLGVGHVLAVRVAVLDVGRELPSVELTPRRLVQVELRTMPTSRSVRIGVPEIERDYHVATDDPAFAAALLSGPVLAALRDDPRIAVRVSGGRLVALASPVIMLDGLVSSVRLLTVLHARLTELADPTDVPATESRLDAPAYTPPSAQRWQLPPFGGTLATAGMRDVQRGHLGDRPYLTFVHQITGENNTTTRVQVIAIALPARLPHLSVWPENALRRLAPSLAVREDIDIESGEFNDRFQVSADNRKYAVDVLNPRAVTALLAVDDFAWRIDGSDLVGMWPLDRPDDPAALRARLAALDAVAEHLPNHVIADHGWTAEPARVDNSTADLGELPPPRAVHVVSAILVGVVCLGAGIPITMAITEDEPSGSTVGAMIWPLVITFAAVFVTIALGRAIDAQRNLNRANRPPKR